MSDIQAKLDKLMHMQGIMSGAQLKTKVNTRNTLRIKGAFEVHQLLEGEIIGDTDDGFFLLRQDFPIDTPHGTTTLGTALEANGKHISFSANDESLSEFDTRKAIFIDTETTGLMGGTGTVTFLVGVGYFIDDVFRLDQCFMRDYDDEEPMLHYLDSLFQKAETLVSYNGKSFDLPLLRTRFITNRIPFRLEGMLHYDLVHASRRFWRQRLRNCSLGNIEREIMGIRRQGDVPGAEIPQIWLNYLHTRDASRLKAVFYHHQMDILSLAALTGVLAQRVDAAPMDGFEHKEDRYSLMRLHFRQKHYDVVLEQGTPLLESLDDPSLRRSCMEMIALASKRLKRYTDEEDAWKHLLTEFPRNLSARRELAKVMEHRKRDLPAAEKLCRDALDYIATRENIGGYFYDMDKEKAAFERRLDRIVKKLKR